MKAAEPIGEEHRYRDAVAHYRSPTRRDAVKRLWEEPFSRAAIALSVPRWLGGQATLTVLDLGCGTGGGYDDLRTALGPPFQSAGSCIQG